jgi:hypothetical protein
MNLHTLVLLSLCLHATYARVLPRQVSQEHDSIAQDSTLVVFGDSVRVIGDLSFWKTVLILHHFIINIVFR